MKMTAVRVKYEFIDGHHVFTSDDVRGLLVVSQDAATAYEDVGRSIETILKLSEGMDCQAMPLERFKDYTRRKAAEQSAQSEEPTIRLSSQDFALSACA